ncbi:MAG: SHOCT-like domain-containing protein [Ktedonobacteraceae bacterium]
MAASIEERNRILRLVESGQVSATEAAQLLDTFEDETDRYGLSSERVRSRTVRVRVTSLPNNRQKLNFNVTLPVGLLKIGLSIGSRLAPQLSTSGLDDVLRAIERGATGRLLDIQDLEEGQRVEIFAE